MLATMAGYGLEVRRGPDCLMIGVQSLEDAARDVSLADQVWDLAQNHFVYRVILELGGVKFVNSHLLGELVWLHQRLHEHGGMLRLCGLSAGNRRILQQSNLSDEIACFASQSEAVTGVGDPRLPR